MSLKYQTSLNGQQGVVVVAETETTNMASILGASHCKNVRLISLLTWSRKESERGQFENFCTAEQFVKEKSSSAMLCECQYCSCCNGFICHFTREETQKKPFSKRAKGQKLVGKWLCQLD